MFMQEGDKSILANVGITVLILTGFMFSIILVANIIS